ncbi:MAG: hypothetical protein WBL63_11830, partial [Candidatus Acidiferrum sp.]
MILRQTIFVLFLLFACAGASAQSNVCEVPDQMTKDQKLPCVRGAMIMLDQPTLTPAQIANGPDFDPADSQKNRFAYFTEADTINCYFRPHYAFQKVPGDSMKFQCWHMNGDGAFYSSKGEAIRVDDAKVVIKKDKNGVSKAALYARNDDKNEHEIKADDFKIKYLKPPFPGHDPRFNEVFTAVASTRFMWLLGFPADHVYPAGSANCIGCTDDPFGKKLTDNKASLKDSPS